MDRSSISGKAGRKGKTGGKDVVFESQDQGARDKKFEGYSNLKGTHEQQQKRLQRKAADDLTNELQKEYIINLHK